jgi:glycosyltransferase involved in cell wall biosynthesis
VAWADERLVVDCGSTDGTPDLARAHGARVIVHDWPGYGAQKDFAADQASHDWIYSIDADERVSPELAAEIARAIASDPAEAGFRGPRVTWFLGRWIRRTDWYPDYQLRLYHRRRARWGARPVHESVVADGPVGRLTQDLLHYPYRDLSQYLQRLDRYTTLAARAMHDAGRRASLAAIALHPPAAFLRNYLLRGGVLDGGPGFIVSALNAYYVFVKFVKLYATR